MIHFDENSPGPERFCNSNILLSSNTSDSGFREDQKFLKPPVFRYQKRNKKKKRKVLDIKCPKRTKRSSSQTVDSIPEENSEELISSDPDIDTVEYTRSEVEDNNQKTVHSIHQIFSELDELVCEKGEDVWEEKARWMKFEQDIHRGADKWGKPHVATLKLHSIISLRKCITEGTVLLGMKAFNLESVIEMTLDRLVSRALITSTVATQLRPILLKRHVHTGEHHDGVFRSYRKKKSKHGYLAGISERISPDISPDTSRLNSRNNSEQDLLKMKQHFLRNLPADTEASNVMIGRLEYLDNIICVTIRLSHSILLGDVTEVPIPTRFIFLLLCPEDSPLNHAEVGRAASTLFSDEMFYKAAYSANSKSELIEGINRFLEKAIVIPPSEWNPRMKITLPEEEEPGVEEEAETQSLVEEASHSHTIPLGGILCDVRSLKLRWLQDWRKGLKGYCFIASLQFSVQVIARTLLMLQICLPIFNFPVGHSLLSVGIIGLMTSLTSCQPLLMTSLSLPLVMWESAAATLVQNFQIDYSSVRLVTGITAGCMVILSSILNSGSYFSIINVFVYETILTSLPPSLLILLLLLLLRYKKDFDVIMCSLVIFFFCFGFLLIWQALTESTFFTKKIRRIIKLLNLLTILLLMGAVSLTTNLDQYIIPYDTGNTTVATPALTPATVLTGTVLGAVLWVMVMVMFTLVMSWVTQPNHRVTRFKGRFWDLIVIGIGLIISGLLGLPFLMPDLLLSVILLRLMSLTSVSNKETLFVKEQRVTLFCSSVIVIVVSRLSAKLHTVLPIPLCAAVILFYRFIGLTHTQLFERCKILLQSEKYHPEKSYVVDTPLKVINSYTILQLILVVVVVVVMVTPFTCVALPVFLIILILLRRHVLPLLLFEDLMTLLEDSSSPVPQNQDTPPHSSSNHPDFCEEVSKLKCGSGLPVPPPDVSDTIFPPQIIFDNLTDDDILSPPGIPVTRDPLDDNEPDEPVISSIFLSPLKISDGGGDFLDRNRSNDSLSYIPLPFNDTDEAVRSEDPYHNYNDVEPTFFLGL